MASDANERSIGDELVRLSVARYRDMSPAQCLAEVRERCEMFERTVEELDPATRARLLEAEPVPNEIIAILEAMQQMVRAAR